MRHLLAFLSCAVFLAFGCSRHKNANYLASLPPAATVLTPVDSLDLEQFGVLSTGYLVKYGRWVAIHELWTEYNLTVLNLDTRSAKKTIAVGRGPGEMLYGSNFYLEGTGVTLTDSYSLMTVSLDMASLDEDHIPPLDTLGVFKSVDNAFSRLRKVKGGYVSPVPYYNTFDENAWYSLWDVDGYVGNVIARPKVEGVERTDRVSTHAFFCSVLMTVHPDKERLCVGHVAMDALSFAIVEDRKLKEVKRLEYGMPKLGVAGNGDIVIGIDRNTFIGITSDKDYVYLLYSGQNRKGPADEANHLIVYDWDGNFVTRYDLSQHVTDIFIDGNELWCLSAEPSCKLLVYRLPEIS